MQRHATETNQNTMILLLFSISNMKKSFSIVSPPTFHLAPRSLENIKFQNSEHNELYQRFLKITRDSNFAFLKCFALSLEFIVSVMSSQQQKSNLFGNSV